MATLLCPARCCDKACYRANNIQPPQSEKRKPLMGLQLPSFTESDTREKSIKTAQKSRDVWFRRIWRKILVSWRNRIFLHLQTFQLSRCNHSEERQAQNAFFLFLVVTVDNFPADLTKNKVWPQKTPKTPGLKWSLQTVSGLKKNQKPAGQIDLHSLKLKFKHFRIFFSSIITLYLTLYQPWNHTQKLLQSLFFITIIH